MSYQPKSMSRRLDWSILRSFVKCHTSLSHQTSLCLPIRKCSRILHLQQMKFAEVSLILCFQIQVRSRLVLYLSHSKWKSCLSLCFLSYLLKWSLLFLCLYLCLWNNRSFHWSYHLCLSCLCLWSSLHRSGTLYLFLSCLCLFLCLLRSNLSCEVHQ